MDQIGITQSVHMEDEQKLYHELRNAVWVVQMSHRDYTTTGTGFCIDSDGLIMTCAHCVVDKSCFVARQNDKKLQKAFVLYRNQAWDIAILCLEEGLAKKDNVPNDYPFVELAKDGTLTPGQDVYAVSHQNNLLYSFCSGKVGYPCQDDVKLSGKPSGSSKEKQAEKDVMSITSKYRTVNEIGTLALKFDKDLPVIDIRNIHIGGGGSGGPIALLTGGVVGMLFSGALSRSYAIHVSALRIAFEEAKKKYTKLVVNYAAKLEERARQKSTSK